MFINNLIDNLTAHRVKYAIVSGYADVLDGVAHGTVDIDLVIAVNKRAYRNAEKAFGLNLKVASIDDLILMK